MDQFNRGLCRAGRRRASWVANTKKTSLSACLFPTFGGAARHDSVHSSCRRDASKSSNGVHARRAARQECTPSTEPGRRVSNGVGAAIPCLKCAFWARLRASPGFLTVGRPPQTCLNQGVTVRSILSVLISFSSSSTPPFSSSSQTWGNLSLDQLSTSACGTCPEQPLLPWANHRSAI